MVEVSISMGPNCITKTEFCISRVFQCSERNPLRFSKKLSLNYEFSFSLELAVTHLADVDQHLFHIFPKGNF